MRRWLPLLLLALACQVAHATASVVQEKAGTYSGATSGTTNSATFTSAAHVGATIEVYFTAETCVTVTSVIDSASQHYTAGASVSDTFDPECSQVYYFQNNASATALTVTVTWASSVAYTGVWIKEIGGVASASVQTVAANYQQNPGTGTDAVTTGSLTPTAQPALISSVSMSSRNTFVAGTGFTSGTIGWGPFYGISESKRLTSTSAIAATYTDGTNGAGARFTSLAVIYTESGGSTCPATGWNISTGTFTTPTAGSGTFWLQTGHKGSTDCATTAYWQPTGIFGPLSTSHQYKWNPGYYGLSYGQPLEPTTNPSYYLSEISEVNAASTTVKGYTFYAFWAGLESSTMGNWQFAGCTDPVHNTGCSSTYNLDKLLNPLRSAGQHAIIVLMPNWYNANGSYTAPRTTDNYIAPNYIYTNASLYGAGVYGGGACAISSTGASGFYMQYSGGFSANIENANVKARFEALLAQLAAVYDNDPVLEGIDFTAMDANLPCSGTGMTGTNFANAWEDIITYARTVFQHTSVGIQVAFDDGSHTMQPFTEWLVQNGGFVSSSDVKGASAWSPTFWSGCGAPFTSTPSGTSGTMTYPWNAVCGSSNAGIPLAAMTADGHPFNLYVTVGSTAATFSPSLSGVSGTGFTAAWNPSGESEGIQTWLGFSSVGSGYTPPTPALTTLNTSWPLVEPIDTCGPWEGVYFTPADIISAANTYYDTSHLSVTILPSCAGNPSAAWSSAVSAMAATPLIHTAYPPVYPH